MDKSKAHQEQNKTLARAVNHLKIELRKSKHEVISLRHQLQLSRENNDQLVEQQTNLFTSIERFENTLDHVFVNNSFNYVLLSTGIGRITSKNPRKSMNHSIAIENDVNNATFCIQSNINTPSSSGSSNKPQKRSQHSSNAKLNMSNRSALPNQAQNSSHTECNDILNTAFLDNPNNVVDVSMIPQSNICSLDKPLNVHRKCSKPSRLPISNRRSINLNRHASGSTDDQPYTTPSRRKCSNKLIDYRELPINRKMRRSN